MRALHGPTAAVLCAAMASTLASCANTPFLEARYKPTDAASAGMTVKHARVVLTESLKAYTSDPAGVRVTLNSASVTHPGGRQVFVASFAEMPEISAHSNRIWLAGSDKQLLYAYAYMNSAHILANALYVLQQHARKQRKESSEFDALFASSLDEYRLKAASADLPEEANKYKVQAEGSVRDKDFDAAVDLYAAALKIAPWWPAGHFNRALVFGEIGDYESAKRQMNFYLQLVPDAANAVTARNKTYDWDRLDAK